MVVSVSTSTRLSVAPSAMKGTSSAPPRGLAPRPVSTRPRASRFAASFAKQTSRSKVARADPCRTAATPPITTKSTLPSTSERSSRSRASSVCFGTDTLGPLREADKTPLRGLERREPLGRRQSQPLAQLRLVDVLCSGELETVAGGTHYALEGCRRWVRSRALE